uniref:SHSP domain-containing protein n=1 Tax=Salarias fasciatus TaxID=181472 RepID=A0A672IBA8_SALFA
MSDQAKEDMPCGGSSTGMSTAPLYRLPSRIFNQDLGLPPFLGLDWLPRGLPVYSWPGFAPAPLFVPHIAGSVHQPSQKIPKWRVGMDVAHFSPSEISVSLKDEFLEVKGKHGERPDEHGFIARCFIRKYRLPAEVDATKITSTLSADGILTVEAPVPEAFVPAAVIIPIKVQLLSICTCTVFFFFFFFFFAIFFIEAPKTNEPIREFECWIHESDEL